MIAASMIRIASLNCNCLLATDIFILSLIHYLTVHNITILLLQETGLTLSHSDISPSLLGPYLLRLNSSSSPYHSTATLFHKSLRNSITVEPEATIGRLQHIKLASLSSTLHLYNVYFPTNLANLPEVHESCRIAQTLVQHLSKALANSPVMVGGDFNEILSPAERSSGISEHMVVVFSLN